MGDCLKRWAWTVCRFKKGLSKREGCFGGRVDTAMHSMKIPDSGHFFRNANFPEKSGTFEIHLYLHAQYLSIFMNAL